MAPNDGLAMLAECPGDAVEKVRVWRRGCDSERERERVCVNQRCGRGVPVGQWWHVRALLVGVSSHRKWARVTLSVSRKHSAR